MIDASFEKRSGELVHGSDTCDICNTTDGDFQPNHLEQLLCGYFFKNMDALETAKHDALPEKVAEG